MSGRIGVPDLLRRFWAHRAGRASALFLGIAVTVCVLAPLLAPAGPDAGSLHDALRRPDRQHWLGTDELGRDVLARLLWGGRVSLSIALLVTALAPGLGAAYGLLAAAAPSVVAQPLMRLVDAVLSTPRLPVYLVLLTLVGPGYWAVVVVMAAFEWPAFARLTFLAARGVHREPFVESARVLGASGSRIARVHIWPAIAGPLVVAVAVGVRGRIVTEASLSFLGFGIVPPTPSWGNMLASAQSRIWDAPSLALYPGLAILAVSVASTLIGDALRDANDPTLVQTRRVSEDHLCTSD